jgi:anti-anti-sigma regulatory factor
MSPGFDIKLLERDFTVILQVEGELDLATAPLLAEKLAEVESSHLVTRILVDLGFAVTRGSPQVQRLFRTAGVIDRLPIAASPDGEC